MQINPYITVTGNVSEFDANNRSFTITPTQYIILTHTAAPFPIRGHFADTDSKKRWGTDGPKVAVGSTITLGGSLQWVVRQRNLDRSFEFAQVKVTTIAYLGTRGNLTGPSSRISFLSPYSITLCSLIISLFVRRSTWKSQNQKKMELERSSKTVKPITGRLTFHWRCFILSSKKKKTWWRLRR